MTPLRHDLDVEPLVARADAAAPLGGRVSRRRKRRGSDQRCGDQQALDGAGERLLAVARLGGDHVGSGVAQWVVRSLEVGGSVLEETPERLSGGWAQVRRRDDPAGRPRFSRERPNRRAAPARAAHDRRPRDKPQIDDSMMSASTRKRAWPCCSASSRHVARAPTGHGLRRPRRTAMCPDLALRRLHGLGPRRPDDLAAHQAVGLDLALPRLWLAFAHYQFRPRQRAEVTGRREVLSTAKVEGSLAALTGNTRPAHRGEVVVPVPATTASRPFRQRPRPELRGRGCPSVRARRRRLPA